jgi:purine nucleoside permease
MNKKTLIHTAFFAEAKPIIEHLKLQCTQSKPYKMYQRDDIVLIVSGMGAKNTLHVRDIFETYEIKKAINIGIAGCVNTSIEIGSLVCTTHQFDAMLFETISSVDTPCEDKDNLTTTLVDMESETFLHASKEFLHVEDIYIFKIVSDHLDSTIPKKEFVWEIIGKNVKSIVEHSL